MTPGDTHQFHISRGFRVIRKNPNRPIIEMKIKGKPGWARIHKFSSREAMENFFKTLLQDEKTLADV